MHARCDREVAHHKKQKSEKHRRCVAMDHEDIPNRYKSKEVNRDKTNHEIPQKW
jgi:hypothetical protein